ncbi:hypothetical protein [Niabella hibiscisoli]|uniref:hypothetical protein n=1 Tax=Niabella hibiscisoli TaxID=1825928 RepID=UPI001F0E2D1D|nr:hypothetical protein [Niabella hibiscisoli]MCH5717141.1 hypothetical protein [Niabella hibiscisoli]
MSNGSTWSRLRWPVKALIVGIPLVGLIWYGSQNEKIKEKLASTDEVTTSEVVTDGGKKEGSENTATGSSEHRSFAYQPEKPVNGELKGVVEVGASGFNSFVVKIDKEKRWEVVSKEFGNSMVYEGLATADDIRQGLKKYLAGMFDKGVANKNMHFVISSGAQKEPKTDGIVKELKKMGYVVNLVTAEQEGKLALKCVQPASYKESSFVTDIGSGNTKLSWYEGSNLKAVEAEGAKYYELNKSDESVYDNVKSKASAIPQKTGMYVLLWAVCHLSWQIKPSRMESVIPY